MRKAKRTVERAFEGAVNDKDWEAARELLALLRELEQPSYPPPPIRMPLPSLSDPERRMLG